MKSLRRPNSGSTGSKLVTVLEVLCPSNKNSGETQEQYLGKQLHLVQSGISLVEIDLLRDGDWIVAVSMDLADPEARTPYRVAVRCGWKRLQAEYYPIRLTDRLPTIRVPLRPTDPDARLDLQALIAPCYTKGGYDDMDYSLESRAPLTPEAARCADRLLRRAGQRSARRRRS